MGENSGVNQIIIKVSSSTPLSSEGGGQYIDVRSDADGTEHTEWYRWLI